MFYCDWIVGKIISLDNTDASQAPVGFSNRQTNTQTHADRHTHTYRCTQINIDTHTYTHMDDSQNVCVIGVTLKKV